MRMNPLVVEGRQRDADTNDNQADGELPGCEDLRGYPERGKETVGGITLLIDLCMATA